MKIHTISSLSKEQPDLHYVSGWRNPTDCIPIYHADSPHAFNRAIGYARYKNSASGTVLYRGQNKLYPSLLPSGARNGKSAVTDKIFEAVCNDQQLSKFVGLDRPEIKGWQDYNWMLVLRDTGKVIGELGIFNVENGRMADVAYRIHPAYWGQGITTEALQRTIRYIFEETTLLRLNASADVRNTGSNRVLEKCGIIREGTVRQGKMVSVYCDYHIYGLLKSDYTGNAAR